MLTFERLEILRLGRWWWQFFLVENKKVGQVALVGGRLGQVERWRQSCPRALPPLPPPTSTPTQAKPIGGDAYELHGLSASKTFFFYSVCI